jgi:hypothetical protein
MFNYIPVKLIVNGDPIQDAKLFNKSNYFKNAFPINRTTIVGQLEKNHKRDKKCDIWTDIEPKNGKYKFELAVQLPFFLPKHKEVDEYLINISGKQYIVSNRHCEFILENTKEKYYLAHYLCQESLEKLTGSKIKHIIISKSLVITNFEVNCDSASKAIEIHFESWLQKLNEDIPNLVTALRYYIDGGNVDLPDCNNIGRFCPIYVLCQGNKLSMPLRFASHLSAYPLQTIMKFSCDMSKIESFCKGNTEIDISEVILRKAVTLMKSGEFSLACVLACSACETYFVQYISIKLYQQGLSKTKKKEAFNDLSFSQMLNLLSYFILNMKEIETKNLIGKVNTLRKIRNDIVHEGKQISKRERKYIENGIEAITELKTYMETLI